MRIDFTVIRKALAEQPDDVSSRMSAPPPLKDIYTPPDHGLALDPNRALVVGARGMGKSFWAGAYADENARRSLAKAYPNIGLDRIVVAQGFTGDEGESAPSKGIIKQRMQGGATPEDLWRAVILKATARYHGYAPAEEREWAVWVHAAQDAESVEKIFTNVSRKFDSDQRRFVVVFDALDLVADDWGEIRSLTQGLLRTALRFRAYRGLRLKIFLRPDQFDDDSVFRFADASKLKAEAVRLEWRPRDLYGLLFTYLLRAESSKRVFRSLFPAKTQFDADGIDALPLKYREDSRLQQELFERIAGNYMGANRRKGFTYTWLVNHLMDARKEVSPRSFLQALAVAARTPPAPNALAIDAPGIRNGLLAASRVRFDQLIEDYSWAGVALSPLADQNVPCEERDFIKRWREAKTIELIQHGAAEKSKLGPVELVDRTTTPEEALLDALIRLGVLERRSDGRINMPDIYRVAAKLLRKGGVPPHRRRNL